MGQPPGSFGERLRAWRARRALSQLALAGAAETSQRHLSFLESGRASPSREMVLRLAAALDIPLRQQNALLLSAGFAPVWRESDLAAPGLAGVTSALDFMLAQQEPYPAFVVDRRWSILRANRGAGRLVAFLGGADTAEPPPLGAINLADALMAPEGLRSVLENWEEVALYFLRSVQADTLADGTPETAALLERLLAYPGVPTLSRLPAPDEAGAPVLAMQFRKDGAPLNLFTTIATLGTPHDVTLQEIRIECFFPADDGSARRMRGWAKGAARAGA